VHNLKQKANYYENKKSIKKLVAVDHNETITETESVSEYCRFEIAYKCDEQNRLLYNIMKLVFTKIYGDGYTINNYFITPYGTFVEPEINVVTGHNTDNTSSID
jgi:hypothetical protein